MGRDHTLFALVPGFVRFFYSKKHMNGERKYVGLVLITEARNFLETSLRWGGVDILDW